MELNIRPSIDLIRELSTFAFVRAFRRPANVNRSMLGSHRDVFFALPVGKWITRESFFRIFPDKTKARYAISISDFVYAKIGVLDTMYVLVLDDIARYWGMPTPVAWAILWRLADEGYIENELMKRDGVYLLTNEAYLLLADEVSDE